VELVVDLSELWGALPVQVDLQVAFVGLDRNGESALLAFGEPFLGAAQKVAYPAERRPCDHGGRGLPAAR
jgi:hypothetical protein